MVYDPKSSEPQKPKKAKVRFIRLDGTEKEQIRRQDELEEQLEAGNTEKPGPRWVGPARQGEGVESIGEAIDDIRDGRG